MSAFNSTYLSGLDVIPPDVRPDRNPVFAVVQLTAGCKRKAFNKACGFCGAYGGIKYYERDLAELVVHMRMVRELIGPRMWIYVKKLFLADADPFDTKLPSVIYLESLYKELPHLQWYEAFVSTSTAISKSINEWSLLTSIGLRRLYWGVESADAFTLKLLGKPHNLKLLYNAAGILNEARIPFTAVVLSGIDSGATEDSLQAKIDPHVEHTVNFIRDVGCESVYVSRFVPQLNTECYSQIHQGHVKKLTADEAEMQHRILVKRMSEFAEVRGSYGIQFVE